MDSTDGTEDETPILKALDGGANAEQLDHEWESAWAVIAAACEEGLGSLHPLHPRRDDLLRLSLDAHAAAGLQREPQMRTA